MKKNILIIAFLILIAAFASFSNGTKLGFVRKASLYDTVKKKDSLQFLDSIKKSDSIRVADSISNL
jgi:rare lipoprotein A